MPEHIGDSSNIGESPVHPRSRMIWSASPSRASRQRGSSLTGITIVRNREQCSSSLPACMVLKCEGSVWVTSWPKAEYVKHAWAGAWVNSCFREEFGSIRASDMIREAIAITRWFYKTTPDLGMITFVDASKVKHKRDPGRCYLKAGFKRVGMTKARITGHFKCCPRKSPDAEPDHNVQAVEFVECLVIAPQSFLSDP